MISTLTQSAAVRVPAREVNGDGQEQEPRPEVHGIEGEGLVVTDEVPGEPDEEPEQGHCVI